jgi:hypothetical protein
MNFLHSIGLIGLTLLSASCASNEPKLAVPAAQSLPYALSKENPVEVCKPAGQREYLSNLVCASGATPTFKRIQNVGLRNESSTNIAGSKDGAYLERMISGAKLQPGEVDTHVVDEYEVMCSDKKSIVYLDMYHCFDQLANIAPAGFILKTVALKNDSKGVAQILDQVKKSFGAQEYQQIKDAVESSETIKSSLEKLYSQKLFTDFVLLDKAAPQSPQFGGFESKGRIFFTKDFLQALTQYRPRSPVYPDDIRPNNTVFAIAHLLHHIKTPIDVSKFSTPVQYSRANLAIEAESFLISWNAMVDAAEFVNKGKMLSNRQAGQLLVNSRYQFPFVGKSASGETLKWLPDGRLSLESVNVRVVADVLANSKIADLK